MFFAELTNRISLIIMVCMCFLSFVTALYMKNDRSTIRLIGLSSWIPLFFGCTSFALWSTEAVPYLFAMPTAFLPLTLLFIHFYSPKKRSFRGSIFFIFAISSILSLLLILLPSIRSLFSNTVVSILALVASIVLASRFFNAKKHSRLISFSMIFIALDAVSSLLNIVVFSAYFSSLMKLMAYSLFYAFIYRNFMASMHEKIVKAEDLMEKVNKDLNYEVKKRTLEIERVNENLVHIAKTDNLTKALNKAAVIDIMERLTLSSNTKTFSVLMFDIDKFKNINDTYGHIAGDKCIRKLAATCKNCIRDIDYLGRYGGDEFFIVLPGLTAQQSSVVAERLRKKVAESETPHFTISIGVATYPQDGVTAKELIAYADEGLYISKNKGRNTVSHKSLY